MSEPFVVPPGELPYGERMRRALPLLHRAFLIVNRYLAAPALRAGLGPVFSTPIAGYLMILRTRGRVSGEMREAPLGYVICGGDVYCVPGFGRGTHWLRNIQADPHVEVVLPGRSFSGVAEEVTDPAAYLTGMRRLMVALGILGIQTIGSDARTASDEELLEHVRGFPLVRIRATGIAAGPFDPGGLAWIPIQAAGAILTLLGLRWIASRLRRLR
jgi:deazaflavin-dependent oxidoreductase (nitroreductase family)